LGMGSACAAAATGDVYIYNGALVSQSGIRLGAWGSGRAIESKEHILAGSASVKVIAQGLYCGGRLDFAQPVPLFTDGIPKTRYIVFSLFFTDTKPVDPAAGTDEWDEIEPWNVPKATQLRFVFVSDTGQKLSVEEPTNPLDPDDNWVRVAVPLAKFSALGDVKEFKLSRLLLFSDGPGTVNNPATMFVGEIKLVTDDKPIKVDSLGARVEAPGYDIFLEANADGGVSSLTYSWDFDNSNGLQQDLTGKVGRVVYTRGGDYTVTVTVSDVDGVKTPAAATGKISVNE